MKSVHLELMEESLAVLDECRNRKNRRQDNGRPAKRNPMIEDMLWEHPDMIRAARRLKIKRPKRTPAGRRPQ